VCFLIKWIWFHFHYQTHCFGFGFFHVLFSLVHPFLDTPMMLELSIHEFIIHIVCFMNLIKAVLKYTKQERVRILLLFFLCGEWMDPKTSSSAIFLSIHKFCFVSSTSDGKDEKNQTP
jgi:hypothetical protein